MKTKITVVLLGIVVCISAPAQDTSGGELYGFQAPTAQPENVDYDVNRILIGSDYKVTPGDTYSLVITKALQPGAVGDQGLPKPEEYELVIDDLRKTVVPYIGEINAAGLTYAELRKKVLDTLRAKIGVRDISFSLSRRGLYEVSIHGAVEKPGSLIITSDTRLASVIGLAGGLKPGASTRRVLIVEGATEQAVDLLAYTARGDVTQNPHLSPGTRVIVPLADPEVQVAGAVRYPGAFELVTGESLGDAIRQAGGLLPQASPTEVELTRVDQTGRSRLQLASLDELGSLEPRDGDILLVRLSTSPEDFVEVEGALYGFDQGKLEDGSALGTQVRPMQEGTLAAFDVPAGYTIHRSVRYVEGMTLLYLLRSQGGPTPYADYNNAFVIQASGDRVPIDLQALWDNHEPSADMPLARGDYVYVGACNLAVFVSGEVQRPGFVAYRRGGRVIDYVLAAGGIRPESGNARRIFVLDELGKRTPTALDQEVGAGARILVDRRPLSAVQSFFNNNIFLVTGLVTTVVTVAVTVWDFVARMVAASQ